MLSDLLRGRRSRAASFNRVGLNGRLVVALIVVQRYCQKWGVRAAALDLWFDHLWEWPTVDSSSFETWSEAEPPLIQSGLGDPLPAELLAQLAAAGVNADEFAALIMHATEIVYSSLYAAADDKGSLEDLGKVFEVAERSGVMIPPAETVSHCRINDGHGWGRKLTREELAALRSPGPA